MVGRAYIPQAADIVRLEFDPQAGREQAGRRPGLVLSPAPYNQKSGLVVACPITSQAKGYPFEVPLPAGLQTKGVILADHLKSLDWAKRKATKIERVPKDVMDDVLAKISALLSI